MMLSVFDSHQSYDPDFWSTGVLNPVGLTQRKCPWGALRETACWFEDGDAGALHSGILSLPDPRTAQVTIVQEWYTVLKDLQRTQAAADAVLVVTISDRQCEQGIAALFLAAVHVYLDSLLLSEPAGRPLPRFRFATATGRSRFALLLQMLDVENPGVAAPTFEEVRTHVCDWFHTLLLLRSPPTRMMPGGRTKTDWKNLKREFYGSHPSHDEKWKFVKARHRELHEALSSNLTGGKGVPIPEALARFFINIQRVVMLHLTEDDLPKDTRYISDELNRINVDEDPKDGAAQTFDALHALADSLQDAGTIWCAVLVPVYHHWLLRSAENAVTPAVLKQVDLDVLIRGDRRVRLAPWLKEWEKRDDFKAEGLADWLISSAPFLSFGFGDIANEPRWRMAFVQMVIFVRDHPKAFLRTEESSTAQAYADRRTKFRDEHIKKEDLESEERFTNLLLRFVQQALADSDPLLLWFIDRPLPQTPENYSPEAVTKRVDDLLARAAPEKPKDD